MDILSRSNVMVFGVGGVGGFAVEALARSGIGRFELIDDDRICMTNINRQILADFHTIGKFKVDIAKERILSVNPKADVKIYPHFYLPDSPGDIDISRADFVLDCIDTVSAKMDIILKATELGVPIISCLGMGNRVDPSLVRYGDIHETYMDPLAKVIRKKCREMGIKKLPVVYSLEEPIPPLDDPTISCRSHCVCPCPDMRKCTVRRQIPGSTAFVPSVAGLYMASYVVRELTHFDPNNRTIGEE